MSSIGKAEVDAGKLSIHSFIHSPNDLYKVSNAGVSLERVNKVELCIEESGQIFG